MTTKVKTKPKRMAMTFMINESLKKKIRVKAFKEGITISAYLNNVVKKDLKCQK